jgi:hypothetical protein
MVSSAYEDVNRSLRVQGRRELARYRAADCSSLEGEFRDWSLDEQKQFPASLFPAFERHRLDLIGISVNLPQLISEIPEFVSLGPRLALLPSAVS